VTITAAEIIEKLELLPHPEGGHYREIYRSTRLVARHHPARQEERPENTLQRTALTSIWFLLQAGEFSAFHAVASDEVWQLVAGGPLELVTLQDQQHPPQRTALSLDWAEGWGPQAVVPAGVYQAAQSLNSWALCTCLVAPGFDFSDFIMPTRGEMMNLFPHHHEVIEAFTRPDR
jgi:predicted cupin superfamily sugar epimerase